MANYYFSIDVISRGKGESAAQRISYITGRKIHDIYNGKTYSRKRNDVIWGRAYVPINGPEEYYELQTLVDALNGAEKRKDARVARYIKGSLPNEITEPELKRIVDDFVREAILSRGLCAVVAIHRGANESDPAQNNPHCHIVFSTRRVSYDGLCKIKDKELDKKEFVRYCRKLWEDIQNCAYEKNGLKTRVDCRTLREQGVDREPKNYLTRGEWWREQRGEHTHGGNIRREIDARNAERQQRELDTQRNRKAKKHTIQIDR